MIRYLLKIIYIVPARKLTLIVLLILFLVVSVLEAFGIGLLGPFINLATNPHLVHQSSWLEWAYQSSGISAEGQFIALIGLCIVLVFCLKSYLSWRIQSYVFIFSCHQQIDLARRLMQAYLFAPYTFHLDKSSSYIIQNIVTETRKFSIILSTLLTAASNFIVLICLSVLLCTTSPLALVSLSFIIIPLFLLLNNFRSKVAFWGKEMSRSLEAIIRNVNHGLGGIKETTIIGCTDYFEEQIAKEEIRYASGAGSFYSFKLMPRILVETLLVIFLIGFTSTYLIYKQNIQGLTAILSVFALSSIRLIPALSNLANALGTLKNNGYVVNKVYKDLKRLEGFDQNRPRNSLTVEKQADEQTANNLGILFKQNIVMDGIRYRYPETSEVALDDLSLTIQKGQSIAFIGKSGAGKTTLADVILGLLIPEQGEIRVDGQSIYNNLRSWQNIVGYIPQSIFLTEDTIEKNIAFGVSDHLIDREKVKKSIKAAQLDNLIRDLPHGVETCVGERGVRLSGGQRQRIGIARALYHEREVLVMDEATAALDSETESLVSQAIRALGRTKTIIIIAHRLSTIEHCDCIYRLDKGRIVDSGSYREVVLGQSH